MGELLESPEGQNNAPDPTVCSEIQKGRKMGRTYLHDHLYNSSTANSQWVSSKYPSISHCCLAALCQPSWVLSCATASSMCSAGRRVVRSGIYDSRETAIFVRQSQVY